VSDAQEKPKHEPPAAETRPFAIATLPGRASPLELIVHAANATGADGVGALLDYREFQGEPRP
jgi:hypothetical protein